MRQAVIEPRVLSTRRDREIDRHALDKMFEELHQGEGDAPTELAPSRPRTLIGSESAGTGISRAAVAGYLSQFPTELQESALIDLLEIVTTELLARQRP